jgi:CRP-like cAMP-binding protein
MYITDSAPSIDIESECAGRAAAEVASPAGEYALLSRMSPISHPRGSRDEGGLAMKRKAKPPFDPKVFLAKVNGGLGIRNCRKDQIVYRQGDPSDSVFYIQSGKVKKTVVS